MMMCGPKHMQYLLIYTFLVSAMNRLIYHKISVHNMFSSLHHFINVEYVDR